MLSQLELFETENISNKATNNIFVTNRTNKNKSKSSKLAQEHILPLHNIADTKNTIPFLREMLKLKETGESVESILYAIGVELTNIKLDEYAVYDKKLKIVIPDEVKNEHDLIGSVYQYLTAKNVRLNHGSFYTNQALAEELVAKLNISENDKILDPACGSGNLLLNSKVKNPLQIFGLDSDPIAIMCCKFNYYLKFGKDAPTPNIFVKDFVDFINKNTTIYDYVLCNPPFGADINITSLVKKTVETEDSLTYFVEHSAKISKRSFFILPESVLNVKKHTALRYWLLKNTQVEEIKSYGANFSGTMFPIVTFAIYRQPYCQNFLFDGKKISIETILNMPYYYFRPIDEDTNMLIKKVFAKGKQSLKGSIFALGVVTGDNKTKLFDTQVLGSEPIITGKDITPFHIATPKKYLIFKREDLQQVAPDSAYRVSEKLIYKVVSRDFIFALDTTGSLTLNSANIVIPRGLTISNKCLMALLNSDLYNTLNKVLYGENKVSRINLENLPIPDMPKDEQIKIEKLVDEENIQEINAVINRFFGIYI